MIQNDNIHTRQFLAELKNRPDEHPQASADRNWVLELLFDAYSAVTNLDDDQICADFNLLYETMNGMTLREMDQIVYPVCTLCRDHERVGFIAGVKIGMRLSEELR